MRGSRVAWAAALCALTGSGCEIAYPEVVVVNNTSPRVVLRDVSFNGCLWTEVIAYGEATSPQRCLPGSARVRLKKHDPSKPAGEAEPRWFNYQTVLEHRAEYGDFQRIELSLSGLEQDFSIAGPYGH